MLPAGSPLSRQSNDASRSFASPPSSPPAAIQATSQAAFASLPILNSAPFIPLERSTQFASDSPTSTITLRKLNIKKYATDELDTDKYRREKLEEFQRQEWSSDSSVKRVFHDVKKGINKHSSRKNSQSPTPLSSVAPCRTSASKNSSVWRWPLSLDAMSV